MSWWFHLLIRRVERIGERVSVAERLARAVGRITFSAQVEPLLTYIVTGTTVFAGNEFVRRVLYRRNIHSPGDLPAFVHSAGFKSWWLWGKRHRPVGKLAIVRGPRLIEVVPNLPSGYYLHGVEVDEHGVPIGRSALRE